MSGHGGANLVYQTQDLWLDGYICHFNVYLFW